MMKSPIAIASVILLVSIRVFADTPIELVGSWQGTQLGQHGTLAALGRPYRAVISATTRDNTINVVVSGCNTASFFYGVDGATLSDACGSMGPCTMTVKSCAFPRINLDGTISHEDETCSDTLPYCRTRLAHDEDVVFDVLKTASSWRFDERQLVVISEAMQAEIHFKRDAG